MTDKPNFVLVPDDAPLAPARAPAEGVLARLRTATSAITAAATALLPARTQSEPPAEVDTPSRPRLIFAVDATASREPAWAAARQVTDALFKALPGELDVALAVHGGSRVHTFTAFTTDANTLRDHAAGVSCRAGLTRLLPILSTSLKQRAVRVVVYIGDVFEESLLHGRRLADAMGAQGTKLIGPARHSRSGGTPGRRDVLGPREAHRWLRSAVRRQCPELAARSALGRGRLRGRRREATAGTAARAARRGGVARTSRQAQLRQWRIGILMPPGRPASHPRPGLLSFPCQPCPPKGMPSRYRMRRSIVRFAKGRFLRQCVHLLLDPDTLLRQEIFHRPA